MPLDVSSSFPMTITPGSGRSVRTLEKYLQLPERSRLTNREIDLLVRIKGAFAFHKIDDETSASILESFERKFGTSDDVIGRLTKFDNFLSVIGNRQGLIDSVKSLGMLSKEETELQAVETGDWVSAIKRNTPSRGLADLMVVDAKDAKQAKDDPLP